MRGFSGSATVVSSAGGSSTTTPSPKVLNSTPASPESIVTADFDNKTTNTMATIIKGSAQIPTQIEKKLILLFKLNSLYFNIRSRFPNLLFSDRLSLS